MIDVSETITVKAASLDELLKEMEEKGVKHEGDPLKCPVHLWARENGICNHRVGTVAYCPVCGSAMCPDCGNHAVLQLSRITGYIQDVSGWNAAKQQELKDRKRYTLEG